MVATTAGAKRTRRGGPKPPKLLSDSIVVPDTDKRLYRLVELDNELRVLLISDPEMANQPAAPVKSADEDMEEGEEEDGEEDGEEEGEEDEGEEDEEEGDAARGGKDSGKKASCAMCCGVGYLSDPSDLGGLAHFVEHMVFMGSEKYPDENAWGTFLNERGGSDNGETDSEHTVFYFDVAPQDLKDALDRFAQFFVSPLFKWDASRREVKAIESEFQQAIQGDSERLAQLMWHECDEAHPYHRFGWGDKRSLEELPAAAGIDVRAAMGKFHGQHYSSNLMTLVMLGQEPLDTLQQWAAESCGAIPNLRLERPSFASPSLPIPDARLPMMRWITPIKQRRCLELQWYVPPLWQHHRAKPGDYVSHLLGHEGKGSCLAALKAAGLADGLSAGVDTDEQTTAATMFAVSVDLTPRGLEQIDAVAQLVFAELGMLARREPEAWVYEEMRDVAALRFRHMEQEEEVDYTRRLAISLQQRLAPAESLCGDCLLSEWDPELVRSILAQLTPERVVAFVMAARPDDAGGGAPRSEPWFGTEYWEEDVGAARLRSWRTAYDADDERLALPPRNEYIPTDFALRYPPPPQAAAAADGAVEVESGAPATRRARTPPTLLRSQPNGQLWHKPDTQWHTPKAVCAVDIVCAGAGRDAREVVLRRLAVEVSLELLNEESYAATVAGLSYDLARSVHGYQLQVEGFSHKLKQMLLRVASTLAGLADTPPDDALLSRLVQRMKLGLQNEPGTTAEELAGYERLWCIERTFHHADEKLAALRDVSAADVQAHVAAMLRGGAEVQVFAGGNLAAAEAVELFDGVVGALRSPPPVAEAALAVEACVTLPAGGDAGSSDSAPWLLRAVPARTAQDSNCAVNIYWQLGTNEPRLCALMSLLEHIMYEPLFDSLRTKQQLGYSVYVSARNTCQTLGLLIGVVSATASPAEVEAAVAEFLETFVPSLETMTAEAYARNVEAAVANRLVDDHNMQEEAMRYFSEIENRARCFDRAEIEAQAMQRVKQPELAEFARRVLLPGGSSNRRMSVHVYRRGGEMGALEVEPTPDGAVPIDDPDAFKAPLAHYTPPHGPLPAVQGE